MKKISELNLPADRFYTTEHVWIKKDEQSWLAGISDYAQDQLGDVLYVDLPVTDAHLAANAEFGTVESVKSVSSLHMPVAGKIIAANEALADNPALVNTSCYAAGWLVRLLPDDPADVEKLMSADNYRAQLA